MRSTLGYGGCKNTILPTSSLLINCIFTDKIHSSLLCFSQCVQNNLFCFCQQNYSIIPFQESEDSDEQETSEETESR